MPTKIEFGHKKCVLPIKIEFGKKKIEFFFRPSLANWIREADTNPNHPLELDEVNAWDIEKRRWVKFKISELTVYQPEGGIGRVEERREDAEDPRGTGHQGTEEGPQEA